MPPPCQVEAWLAGFQLSDVVARVVIIRPKFGTTAHSRALVTFSNPEEALLATWSKHMQMMGSSPVSIRLLQ